MTGFDADRYRECLTILGLSLDASEAAIREAYREKAKKWHPDRFHSPAEKGVATKRIKRLNNARDYVLQYRDDFVCRYGGATANESDRPQAMTPEIDDDERIDWFDVFPDNGVFEFLLIPVYAVWSIAFAVAMTPLFYFFSYRTHGMDEMGRLARWWVRVGPYFVLLLLPLIAVDSEGAIWFWIVNAIVFGAEVAAHITGWWIQRSNREAVAEARAYLQASQ